MTPESAAVLSIDELVGRFGSVSLEELNAVASLLARVDRKYVVSLDQVVDLLRTQIDSLAILEIDGRRVSEYRSTYFDTDDLRSYRMTAHGSRMRFKIRVREYLDDGAQYLEIKTLGRRDETLKTRISGSDLTTTRLGPNALSFIHETIGPAFDLSTLTPTVTTAYRRLTLLERSTSSRVTVDLNLAFGSVGGAEHHFDAVAIVETKSARGVTGVDRALWGTGLRPVRISKYGIAMALTHDELAANKWNRVLRKHFGWNPLDRVGSRTG